MNYFGTVLFAALMALTCASSAFATEQPEPAIPKQYTVRDFANIVDSIRLQMQPDGRYANVPKIDRTRIEEGLQVMSSLLDSVDSIEALSEADRVRLFNAQEKVNGLLLQHDSERLYCEKTRVTGSHRPRMVCMTYAEREAARENARRLFRVYDRGWSPN